MKTSRVGAGMVLEAFAVVLAILLLLVLRIPWLPGPLPFLLAQGVILYCIHCPSHYAVGRMVGIKFSGLVVGRSALRKSSSRAVRLIGERAVTPVLIVDRASLARASPLRRKAMFYSGVTASTAAPFLVALYASLTGDPLSTSTLIAVIVAIGYLTFNIFYSPRTGDIHRARLLGGSSPQGGQQLSRHRLLVFEFYQLPPVHMLQHP